MQPRSLCLIVVVAAACHAPLARTDAGAEPDASADGPGGLAACENGIDDDGDGLADFPIDPACATPQDDDEHADGHARDTVYAFVHYLGLPNSASYFNAAPIGNSGVCQNYFNPSNVNTPFHPVERVVYPWVLSGGDARTLDPVRAKAYLDQFPPGARAVFSWNLQVWGRDPQCDVPTDDPHPGGNTLPHPDDNCRDASGASTGIACPWQDAWLAHLEEDFAAFFDGLASAGGNVDVFMSDTELHEFYFQEPRLSALQLDPRFAVENTRYPVGDPLREPLATAFGPSGLALLDETCGGVPCHWHLRRTFGHRLDHYLQRAMYAPIRAAFPDVTMTNYLTYSYDFERFLTPTQPPEYAMRRCPDDVTCIKDHVTDTLSQPSFLYSLHPTTADFNNTWLDGTQSYVNDAFNGMKDQVFQMRAIALSDPRGVAPLVGSRTTVEAAGTDRLGLYEETLLHLLLEGPAYFNYWYGHAYDEADDRVIDRVFAEFEKVAGFAGRVAAPDLRAAWAAAVPALGPDGEVDVPRPPWLEDWLMSAMDTGGRRVWRFTPRTHVARGSEPEVTVESTLIATSPPTFRTRQAVITFPDGVLWRPIDAVSTEGYWIVQPAGAAAPVIVADGVNTPPMPVLAVRQTHLADYQVELESHRSFDPDGAVAWADVAYDLDGDGDFGDLGEHRSWVRHQFPGPGPRTVRVRVVDDQGATATATISFELVAARCDDRAVGSPPCPVWRGELDAE